jgi:hypothetical protein
MTLIRKIVCIVRLSSRRHCARDSDRVLALAVAWGIWVGVRPRAVFVIRIRDGKPRAQSGTVPRAFLREVAEICERSGLRRGTVRGVVQGDRVVLGFSRDVPDGCRQMFRNLWSLSGWSVRPGAR